MCKLSDKYIQFQVHIHMQLGREKKKKKEYLKWEVAEMMWVSRLLFEGLDCPELLQMYSKHLENKTA